MVSTIINHGLCTLYGFSVFASQLKFPRRFRHIKSVFFMELIETTSYKGLGVPADGGTQDSET